MDCSCGRTVGFLFECVVCDGPCCLFCTPQDMEICQECYKKQKIKDKDDLCDICGESKTVSGKCNEAICHVNYKYCTKCALDHRCSYVNIGGPCQKLLCKDHWTCNHRVSECRYCHTYHKNANIVSCERCDVGICKGCRPTYMPYYQTLNVKVCTKHMEKCTYCNYSSKLYKCKLQYHPIIAIKGGINSLLYCNDNLRCFNCDSVGQNVYCSCHITYCHHSNCMVKCLKDHISINEEENLQTLGKYIHLSFKCAQRLKEQYMVLCKYAYRNGIVFPPDIGRIILKMMLLNL